MSESGRGKTAIGRIYHLEVCHLDLSEFVKYRMIRFTGRIRNLFGVITRPTN